MHVHPVDLELVPQEFQCTSTLTCGMKMAVHNPAYQYEWGEVMPELLLLPMTSCAGALFMMGVVRNLAPLRHVHEWQTVHCVLWLRK